jgi:hypothetical protein
MPTRAHARKTNYPSRRQSRRHPAYSARLQKNNFSNKAIVARAGKEALDYLFPTGPLANRATTPLPQVILLDLKLPKLDANEAQDRFNGYGLGANGSVRKPAQFDRFSEPVRQPDMHALLTKQAARSLRRS